MPISRRGFLASCLTAGAFALTGCARGERLYREQWYLFGTLVDVALSEYDKEKVAPALIALSTRLQHIHHQWHAWKPGELLRLNQAIARGESMAVDPELARLLKGTQSLHRLSEGAFNPAIGGVIGLWGFHSDELPKGAPPRVQQIERLLADQPNPQELHIADGIVSSSNPQVQLDLGGYGKGYAIDLGMALLREHGIANGVINAGGDLCVIGSKSGRPWRIAIRHPQGKGALAWLETSHSESVFTSGNYERYRDDHGKRYAHIINPRTGMPVDEIVSATVVHHNGAVSDAAATALVVAGPERWHETATTLGINQAMIVDRHGRVQVTRALADRLYLEKATLQRTTIV
jgi:thiamine biosynthesis lipoprotein